MATVNNVTSYQVRDKNKNMMEVPEAGYVKTIELDADTEIPISPVHYGSSGTQVGVNEERLFLIINSGYNTIDVTFTDGSLVKLCFCGVAIRNGSGVNNFQAQGGNIVVTNEQSWTVNLQPREAIFGFFHLMGFNT